MDAKFKIGDRVKNVITGEQGEVIDFDEVAYYLVASDEDGQVYLRDENELNLVSDVKEEYELKGE